VEHKLWHTKTLIPKVLLPLGKSQPSKSLWYGTNHTSQATQIVLYPKTKKQLKQLKQEESGKPMAQSQNQKSNKASK